MSVHTKMVMLIMCRCEIEEYKQMARKKLYGTQKKKKNWVKSYVTGFLRVSTCLLDDGYIQNETSIISDTVL